MFKKTFNFIFFISFFILVVFLELNFSLMFHHNLSDFFYWKSSCLTLGFSLSLDSLLFLFMVMLVTSMVLLYSEVYMDHYNNKKFFFSMISFLISMILLSLSSSPLVLMIGWDGLGLSSLFLIMFYPGKIPLYNSFLTFFFNRLSDCFMILVLCFLLLNYHYNFFFLDFNNLVPIISLFLVCSMAKSAQFPLSSWLPAAMSAPTPISAMVHSSTLVTAGIFMLYKIQFYIFSSGFTIFLIFVSSLTFLLGGLLGSFELDLKKIVAFSTMSQISMIIFFLSLLFLIMSLSHMFFHALFKTLLFCSCGILFMSSFSDQSSKNLFVNFCMKNSVPFLIFSIFSMSGLYFSSSFYSKDFILEILLTSFVTWSFMILLLGSSFTIIYSGKILKNFFTFESMQISMKKNYNFFFFLLFSFLTLFSPFIIQFFFPMFYNPILGFMEINLIVLVLLVFIFLNLKFNKISSSYSSSVVFSKFFLFSMSSKILWINNTRKFLINDQVMFKSWLSFKTI